MTFKELTDEVIAEYVAGGEPMDKAGAYGIQGDGRALVESIDGDFDNIVGLPVKRLMNEFSEILKPRSNECFSKIGAWPIHRLGVFE